MIRVMAEAVESGSRLATDGQPGAPGCLDYFAQALVSRAFGDD
jgi:hypothetical protein